MTRVYAPTCFVISEIGAPHSPERARADRFLHIIDQALIRVSAGRASPIKSSRFDWGYETTIFDKVVEKIVTSQLVVAVLSNRNPNAHLELGIALAAGRNVELLIADTKDLPSDLTNYLYVLCDLDHPEAAIEQLAARFEQSLAKPENSLAFNIYSAFAKAQHGVEYLNRFKQVTIDEWSELLWNADEQLTIATTNLKHIGNPYERKFYTRKAMTRRRETGDTSFSGHDISLFELLAIKAGFHGVRVRLMVLSESNPFLREMIHHQNPTARATKYSEVQAESIATMRRMVEYIKTPNDSQRKAFLEANFPRYDNFQFIDSGSFEFVVIHEGPLYRRVTLSEDQAIVTPYHLIEPYNSELPCFKLTNTKVYNPNLMQDGKRGGWENNLFYDKVVEDLDELYDLNRHSVVRLDPQGCRNALLG